MKINRKNYLLYLVVFTLILLLFLYLFSDKDAIVRQLYKELYQLEPSSFALYEGLDGLDWEVYDSKTVGYNKGLPLTDTSNIKPLYSGTGAKDLSSLAAITGNVVKDNTDLHNFTIILKGSFTPDKAGNWMFSMTSDDASFLWIGDAARSGWTIQNALIDNGGEHPMVNKKASIFLRDNIQYPIRIQMGELGGGYGLNVQWQSPSSDSLTSDGTNLLAPSSSMINSAINAQQNGQTYSGLYWKKYDGYFNDNVNLSSSLKMTNSGYAQNTNGLNQITGGKIREDLCISGSDPNNLKYMNCSGSNSNNFSLELTGYFYTKTQDTNKKWSFYIVSDDASYLWINNNAANGWTTENADIKNGGLHSMQLKTTELELEPNKFYNIKNLQEYNKELQNVERSFCKKYPLNNNFFTITHYPGGKMCNKVY